MGSKKIGQLVNLYNVTGKDGLSCACSVTFKYGSTKNCTPAEVKHIFDFSQTAAQIIMKFGSYMHISKVTQVCSNQGCMTYLHRIMLMSF